MEVGANLEQIKLNVLVDRLHRTCHWIQDNLATARREEHFYWEHSADKLERVTILTGSGSKKVFRDNLYKRLAEAFANLAWLKEKVPHESNQLEFGVYQNLCRDLRKVHGPLPQYLEHTLSDATSRIHSH